MTTERPTIHSEQPADHDAVYEVHEQAFERAGEADLVEALRWEAHPTVSLVAKIEERIVGHIIFSPVEVESLASSMVVMGLAPMAVRPSLQQQGIGSVLVREGLQACERMEAGAVVVLGHSEYYPRFGFRPARRFGLQCEYDIPPEAFMALELEPGALDDAEGTVRYHDIFGSM
jgi:putative acetyltransferase